jgi:hypothetical protein
MSIIHHFLPKLIEPSQNSSIVNNQEKSFQLLPTVKVVHHLRLEDMHLLLSTLLMIDSISGSQAPPPFRSYAPPTCHPPEDDVSQSTTGAKMNCQVEKNPEEQDEMEKMKQTSEESQKIPIDWDFEYPDGETQFETSSYSKKSMLGVRWATFTRTYNKQENKRSQRSPVLVRLNVQRRSASLQSSQ